MAAQADRKALLLEAQFTTNMITNALGMAHESKTMSRMIEEIQKVHGRQIMKV